MLEKQFGGCQQLKRCISLSLFSFCKRGGGTGYEKISGEGGEKEVERRKGFSEIVTKATVKGGISPLLPSTLCPVKSTQIHDAQNGKQLGEEP